MEQSEQRVAEHPPLLFHWSSTNIMCVCVCVNVINKSKLESSINNTDAGNEGTGSNREHRNTQIALMTTGHKLSFSIGSVRKSALLSSKD